MDDLWYLLPVHPEVLLEVSRLAESLPANVAHIGSLPSVEAGVNDHLVPLCEGLLAVLARVGPGVSVDALVLAKEVAALEVLWTVHTLEWSLTLGKNKRKDIR